ncbi:hypothetical protein E8D34_15945 [Nocardioides sp. GY 10113]|uniref:hypothetical protein n=1 Tax=Nocardioides sp. GY 10113 TaxID=2569761 RepID=UPI0010A8CC25|nr:hypothetical protein [Nocardioides sp. GY 10113]TIC83614.1 hypothetical protein E8D34_15945 [Nocardioides sp. GY 10113]
MSNTSRRTVRFTLDMNEDQHKQLRIRALQEGRPAAELCRELIAAYLGQAEALDDARLRAAYEAGARAERERIVTSALHPTPPTGPELPTQRARPGLPTQPPAPRG